MTSGRASALPRAQMVAAAALFSTGGVAIKWTDLDDYYGDRALRGTLLYRADDDRVSEDDAWYDHDLIGCEVRTASVRVGEVVDVVHLPAQDLLSVPLTMIIKILFENTDDLRWIAVMLDNRRGAEKRLEAAEAG